MTATRRHPGTRFQATMRRWHGVLARHGTTDDRVHEARVVLKEARALLRLFRATMGEAEAVDWNQRLRAAMKALAPSRDELVMNAVVRGQAPLLRREEDRTMLLRALPRPRQPTAGALGRIGPLLDQFGGQVGAVVKASDWSTMDLAFARVLRRVRRLQTKAGRDETPALWHRWRRRVKELAYQADFVRPPDRPKWKEWRQNAWKLQSKLGDLQDLHVTLDHLAALEVSARTQKAMRTILGQAIDKARHRAWKARLRKKALGK